MWRLKPRFPDQNVKSTLYFAYCFSKITEKDISKCSKEWYSRWLIVQKDLILRISIVDVCTAYCTLKGAGPDKSNIRRDGIGDVWTKYENCFCGTEMNVNVPPPCSRLETTDNLNIQLVNLAQCG